MSSSRHPRALSLEKRVSDATKLLAIVMCLPLLDGVFIAVVLGGALDSAAGILEVGLLIFGGSAMVAVILAELDEPPRRAMKIVLGVGLVVVAGAALQAALAPTVESAIDMAVFERFAALVVLAVAASTASAKIEEYLPNPALIIALGLVATVTPGEATLALQTDPSLIARAVAAAGVGVCFGLVLAAASPWLREVVELDRFRFGSAVALGVLAVSIAGLLPADAPLALFVLAMTALLAFDPSRLTAAVGSPREAADGSDDAGRVEQASDEDDESAGSAESEDPGEAPGPATPAASHSGEGPTPTPSTDRDETSGFGPGQDRPPWL